MFFLSGLCGFARKKELKITKRFMNSKTQKGDGHASSAPHLRLGKKGEDLAEACLKKKGYRIVERNFRCPFGEIDLIARDGKTVVFVEIKARSRASLSPPYLAVNKTNRKKITKSAEYYLSIKKAGPLECRFDIVSIVFGKDPEVEVIQMAF